jgi:hypothetical protein
MKRTMVTLFVLLVALSVYQVAWGVEGSGNAPEPSANRLFLPFVSGSQFRISFTACGGTLPGTLPGTVPCVTPTEPGTIPPTETSGEGTPFPTNTGTPTPTGTIPTSTVTPTGTLSPTSTLTPTGSPTATPTATATTQPGTFHVRWLLPVLGEQ